MMNSKLMNNDYQISEDQVSNLVSDLSLKADSSVLSNYVPLTGNIEINGPYIGIGVAPAAPYTLQVNQRLYVVNGGTAYDTNPDGINCGINAIATTGASFFRFSNPSIVWDWRTTNSGNGMSLVADILGSNPRYAINVDYSTGRVGILNQSPAYALDVGGNINSSGAVYATGFYCGGSQVGLPYACGIVQSTGTILSRSHALTGCTLASTGVYNITYSPPIAAYNAIVLCTTYLDSVTTKPFVFTVSNITTGSCTVNVYDMTATPANASFNVLIYQ